MQNHIRILVTAASCFSVLPGSMAGERIDVLPSSGPPALTDPGGLVDPAPESMWKWSLDSRFRWEYGDQDGYDDSNAFTLRNRIGLLATPMDGLRFFAEYEGTLVADRDGYRAASVHGPAGRTVIADPESHELNQAWVAYHNWDTEFKVGRQTILLNNQRFVGPVGWRQNNQTFDAVSIVNQSVEDLKLTYAYVNRANRIFGSGDIDSDGQKDFKGDTHLFNAVWSRSPQLTLSGYAYFMDLHNPAGDGASNNTYGIQALGSFPIDGEWKAKYLLEVAYQTDGADNPVDYDTWYYHAMIGAGTADYTVGVGFESLGSDNGRGFQTPLATLHAFNGWADKFLGTPGEGLNDLYLFADASLAENLNAKIRFHWFGEESGGFDYGTEADAALVYRINDHMAVGAKYAYYFADEFSRDTQRFVLDFGLKY